MIKETVSASEIESREACGWRRTGKECWIAGKLRTAEMEKEGSPAAWIETEKAIKAERMANLTRSQRRMAKQRDYLRSRGLDV